MQNYWTGGIMRGAMALLLSPVLFAQTPTRPEAVTSTPDLSGWWQAQRLQDARRGPARDLARFSEEDAPLQPWALEIYKASRGGVTNYNGTGVNGLDPSFYCLPMGIPRVYTAPSPIEIVQVPGRIYMHFQDQQALFPRFIYTDGRGHPEGYPHTAMGHSIGRWDGDTLVIDTVNLDTYTWMDDAGTPHSDALRVVERLRRVAHDTLEVDFLFEDPKAFTRPWRGRKVLELAPDWEFIPAFLCEDRFTLDFERKSLRNETEWIERPR